MKNFGRPFLTRLCACLILATLLLPCVFPCTDTACADMTCVYCNGRGERTCSNCNGTGSAPGSVRGSCYKCHGSGYETCIYCKGTGRVGAPIGGGIDPDDPGGGGGGGGGGSEQPKAMYISTDSVSVTVGHTYELSVKNAQGTVTWKSSKPKIASGSSSGKVTGKAAGKTTITASCSGQTFTCKVTVTEQVKAGEITLSKKTVTVPNHGTQALKYTITPDAATVTEPYTLKWTSSDTGVATVSKAGIVTAKKAGSTKVTVQLKVGGKVVDKATCTVKVKAVSAKKIVFGKKAVTVLNGNTQSLKYTITPAESTLTEPYTLKFTSSNTKVASVSKTGVVTAKKAGTAKVTVQLKVGGKVVSKAACTVKVKSIWAKTVAFTQDTQTLREGKTVTLSPRISPETGTLTEPYSLKWSSSASDVAAVSDKGVVTAMKAGTATVTVKLIVKGKAVSTANCTVTVQTSQTQLMDRFRSIAADQGGSLVYTSGDLKVTCSSSGIFSFTKDEGYTTTTLTMPQGFIGNGRLDYAYTSPYGSGLTVKAYASVPLTAIVYDAGYQWTFTSGDNASMANTSVNVLMDLISSFLSGQMSWTLRDIGIPNY